jgi:Ca2+/H+ antiporter, TMEM165/GDT1 family
LESLIPAFLAVLFAEMGSKTQNISKVHGQIRSGSQALIAVTASSIVAYSLAAVGGLLIAGRLAFDARSLLFALALLFAGLPMVLAVKPAQPLETKPSFSRTLWAFGRSQFGDGSQFIVFGLAARTGSALLPTIGAVCGVLAACALPLIINNDWPEGNLLRIVRGGAGTVLSITGFVIAINALQLTGA